MAAPAIHPPPRELVSKSSSRHWPRAIHRRAGSRGLESRLTPSVTRRSTQKPTPMANLARSCSVFYLRWKRARTEGPREHESDREDWSGPSNDSRRCQLHCCPCPACSRHAHRPPIQNPGSVQWPTTWGRSLATGRRSDSMGVSAHKGNPVSVRLFERVIRCQFVFSGKNYELTPHFDTSTNISTPDFPLGAEVSRWQGYFLAPGSPFSSDEGAWLKPLPDGGRAAGLDGSGGRGSGGGLDEGPGQTGSGRCRGRMAQSPACCGSVLGQRVTGVFR